MNLPTLPNEIRPVIPDERPDVGPRDLVLPLASPPLRRTRFFGYNTTLLSRQVAIRDTLS